MQDEKLSKGQNRQVKIPCINHNKVAKKPGFITRDLDLQVGSSLPSSWNKADREDWRLLAARKNFLKILKGNCDISIAVLIPVGQGKKGKRKKNKSSALKPVLPLVKLFCLVLDLG